ncbi:MAG: 2-amino-4-hydroxy-6-hydroxymethyldihydropteridine diphosphokinase [Aestuariivita sp.]|nr:2-amino-4-hydroxy-6-hydroxymethyldihydropteridine diphosphokinase [Aestuariivita sp.]
MLDSNLEMFIAMGANLPVPEGSPAMNLVQASHELTLEGLSVRRLSRFFSTPCFPVGFGPDYVNAAAVIHTKKTPKNVLESLHRIEKKMGRDRATRWGMRTLDLDLIAAEQSVIPSVDVFCAWESLDEQNQQLRSPQHLILPHPRMAERAFVLVPLHDIAPTWRHPILKKTIAELVHSLPVETLREIRAL